jgi:hypothetical protein
MGEYTKVGVQSVRTMIVLGHLACLLLDSTIVIRTVDWTPVRYIDLREEARPCRFWSR